MNALLLLVALSLQPRSAPEQVHIAFGDDPQTTMSVVWQTANSVSSPRVEFGRSGAFERKTPARRIRYSYETGAIWEARLSGLTPGVTYRYRVGDAVGGWSTTYSFHTAPKNPGQFVFTAFGDHGITAEAAKNVRNVLREEPAFHLLLGDVSYANGHQPIWDEYLRQIEPMAARVPFMLTLGNHENEKTQANGQEVRLGYAAYLARFALPGREENYAFDYGNARFVAFNSDRFRDETQLRWLESELSNARRNRSIKWIVVFQHHPLYGSSAGREDNAGLIQTLMPIFDRYQVDLVLAGHDHHYERQYPIRAGKVVNTAKSAYRKGDGTLYVIQGGGGKSLYDFTALKPAMCAFREKTTGYLKVTVRKEGVLTLEAKRTDGSVMETVEIKG